MLTANKIDGKPLKLMGHQFRWHPGICKNLQVYRSGVSHQSIRGRPWKASALRGRGVGKCRHFADKWGGVFRCGRLHFLEKKIRILHNLWCVRTDKGEPVRTFFGKGGMVNFSRFCADGP